MVLSGEVQKTRQISILILLWGLQGPLGQGPGHKGQMRSVLGPTWVHMSLCGPGWAHEVHETILEMNIFVERGERFSQMLADNKDGQG